MIEEHLGSDQNSRPSGTRRVQQTSSGGKVGAISLCVAIFSSSYLRPAHPHPCSV